MKSFKDFLIKFFELDKFDYKNIIIKKSVVENISKFAKKSYPSEFIAFLKGEKINENLVINSLIYQEFESSKSSAFTKMNLPILSGAVGTVHSHPSYSNFPSKTDLRFFNKNFGIHLIISYPFSIKDIKAYDPKGNRILLNI